MEGLQEGLLRELIKSINMRGQAAVPQMTPKREPVTPAGIKNEPVTPAKLGTSKIPFLTAPSQKIQIKVLCEQTRELTTQGSVSGPYLFNIFLNDLEIKLGNETLGFKYADDCTIIAPVYYYKDHSVDLINQFLQWASQNRMNSNSTKCKELIMYKKGHTAEAYKSIFGIPQTSTITILGLTFQPNCKFSTHLKEKLGKANKCLYVIRCLRKEGCSQAEVDVLFNSIVLPNITYALSVHGASESELTIAQQF